MKLRDKAHAVYDLYCSSADFIQPNIDITKELIGLLGKSQSPSAPSSQPSPSASQHVQNASKPSSPSNTIARSDTSPDIPLRAETGISTRVDSSLQNNWNAPLVPEQNVGQPFMPPQFIPDIPAMETEDGMVDVQWQSDLEAMLSQPLEFSMPAVEDAPQDPHWGTDAQLTWQGFMMEMLQASSS